MSRNNGEPDKQKSTQTSGTRRDNLVIPPFTGTQRIHENLPNQGNVFAVSVKIPPFYYKNAETWFKIIEASFEISNVTRNQTKKSHLIANLPEDVAARVLDGRDEEYEEIKARIIKTYEKDKTLLLEEILGEVRLDGKTPSNLLQDMRAAIGRAGVQLDNDVIKHKFLKALPSSISQVLIMDDDLDTIAGMADKMIVFAHLNQTNVSSVQNTSRRYNFHQTNKSKRRPLICNGHYYYASNARTCTKWCKWPGKKPSTIKSRENTPNQSRSNSPNRNQKNQ